jgi:hypothetical protein
MHAIHNGTSCPTQKDVLRITDGHFVNRNTNWHVKHHNNGEEVISVYGHAVNEGKLCLWTLFVLLRVSSESDNTKKYDTKTSNLRTER